ncbi:hypothetical protein [Saliphagus infecundisoli]|uniref:Uncharacterized protein n=1 Tax=Saliphagus infecundisoli TaxID=1849069 RepID=A0ABD5QGA4_9EURY|nr:hypothetical protein [Saliphagus infecundisoli]
MSDRFEELLEAAEDAIDDLDEMDLELEGSDPDDRTLFEELTHDQVESLVGNLEALSELVEEAIDLLEAIEFSELPEAIDRETALEAIDTGEIPDAIADGESDDVVRIGRLARAINVTELWDAVDIYDLLESARELDDELEEVEEESEEGSLLDEAAESMIDEEGGDGEGWTDDLGDLGDEFGEEFAEEVGSIDFSDGDSFGMDAEETEAYQAMIQQAAMAGIDEFREALIATHGEFQSLYEFNREKMRRTDRSSSSRNPTAASTMPVERGDLPSVARTSTVPRKVRHSNGPTRKRIYGRRFEAELERQRAQRGDDGR